MNYLRRVLLLCLLGGLQLRAADLPTITVDHLYYLSARAERVRKMKPDEMIEYCLAQKLVSDAFGSLYSQLSTMRVGLAELLELQEVPVTDSRVIVLKKKHETYSRLLRDEAIKVQKGIMHEGQVANDTLDAMARAQAGR